MENRGILFRRVCDVVRMMGLFLMAGVFGVNRLKSRWLLVLDTSARAAVASDLHL